MTVLALETSCDETAVAILRDRELLASEVASQIALHEKFGGVVPEVASRNHLRHAPGLLERAIRDAKIDIKNVDAFAATSGPGLASSLMIGASIAKGLAVGFSKPYLAINHLEGHLLSPFFRSDKIDIEPNVSLVVSGGHTLLVEVLALNKYRVLGRTVDDAAGEAFDKVAKLLGLGYPGGPEIERLAQNGDRKRFDLPRSMLDSENFSFSGLKTAVRYLLPKIAVISTDARDDKLLADLCASFQQAVIDVLVRKTIAAAKKRNVDLVTLSGGVSCNEELRKQMRERCALEKIEFKVAEPWLCTDNAAMIAFAASLRLQSGFVSNVRDEIDPNLALA
ncbi:MAG: tRNA N6-adenosine threonylcarbamoyltransferase [Verrucomicrobiota bacterium]|jgi:N6-L-threonylcarbamoyladenine synthase